MPEIPGWLVRVAIRVSNSWPWLAKTINRFAINKLVNACRERPHPWSTVHDYVSWTSLTDQRWSSRHLPAVDLSPDLPASEALVGLFTRDPDTEQRPCDKSTSLFPAFAQYLTDGFIRTRMPQGDETDDVRRQNTSNHQIDMCPLYGRLAVQTHALRLNSEAVGSRGRLKSQIVAGEEYAPYLFADDGALRPEFEILDKPLGIDKFTDPDLRAHIFAFGGDRANNAPQVAMMNTLFLREHNRLAGVIEQEHPGWDDERDFETARNTVIALFIKMVVEEYINHISSAPFRLSTDPSVAWEAPWNRTNWISTEFSLLYRWHSLVPDVARWNGQSFPVHATLMDNRLLLAGGLAGGFADMSAQPAGRLGPFNTPEALLAVERNAIEQGRRVRLAPYADYCVYVGRSRPETFADISGDPAVVEFLSKAYKKPADVDFYIGLFAEDQVPNSPLPPLLLNMVAVDAFSQALTNPLLSKHVFRESTFSSPGWKALNETGSLRDIVDRNSPGGAGTRPIGMTRKGWKFAG